MIGIVAFIILYFVGLWKLVSWYDDLYKHDYYYRWLNKMNKIKKSLKMNKRSGNKYSALVK